ncbi:rhomboid family membrane protein-like protein [Lindgomyces ingoldianus]|uniref:Rhomboid family membrane protein-like protein n=1 Tax=Lindgomyces ingoldianus TaxID=673940 RepID=A0ACB6QV85_9PLEO|nr:rhomboid family membrane protein-like protein [Lindgomyces ingoldianus]KAF2470106.1 rhomboid family membrane protein-like protein [Lindgomyces ingoldianus]
MAANDYYNTSFSPSSHQPPHKHTDDPLPPVPTNHSTQSISPINSPFDDNNRYDYPPTHSQSTLGGYNDTSYHGASDRPPHRYDSPSHNTTDPFADQNAIPLQSQGKMDGSPTRYNADPEGIMYPQDYRGHEKSRKKKKGWFSGRVTWVVYILTTVQIAVFVGEIIKNAVLTKSPIEIHPQFNIMIGPSPYVLINMGARYPPCMHNIRDVTDFQLPIPWPCPNQTTLDNQCSLKELCGMGSGVPDQVPGTDFKDRSHEPNQWWRFIVPIFLHAGLIHIGFNMLLQMTLGRDMEKEIGSLRFALVYFSAGIFGFVLGGNYAAPNIPSVGASGSLFGILALVLLDLLYNWSSRRSPVKDLLFLLLDIAIAFVLGLLPGLDNFSHIGGFLMGLVLGICLMHSPQALRERIGTDEPPYSTVDTTPLNSGAAPGIKKFVKQPVGFFKGRKPFWWVWWLARAGALVAVFIGFILLLKNFYEWRNECKWCHHLTCLPIKNWCDIGNFNLTVTNVTNETIPSRLARDILAPVSLGAF